MGLFQVCVAACCNTMHYTATHCNTLQRTATHCDTLQHLATHCNTQQHTATHWNTLQHLVQHPATSCNTLQHTTTFCNTLQHTTTACNTLQHTTFDRRSKLERFDTLKTKFAIVSPLLNLWSKGMVELTFENFANFTIFDRSEFVRSSALEINPQKPARYSMCNFD